MTPTEVQWVYVPVEVREGQLQCVDGLAFPGLLDGSKGYVEVLSTAFNDVKDLKRFVRSGKVLFLKAQSRLLVNVNPQSLSEKLAKFYSVLGGADLVQPVFGGFVDVVLLEDLFLEFGRTRRPFLRSAQCQIQALNKTAGSVNHAYSLLSEAYEPHRRSHAGNVFEKVFFRDADGWQPLDVLRLRQEQAPSAVAG